MTTVELPPPTKRLVFRSLTIADAATGLQLILDDPAVRSGLGWVGTHSDAARWISNALELAQASIASGLPGIYTFAAVSREDSSLAGIAQAKLLLSRPGVITAEPTVFIDPGKRGQGYGDEILAALIDWAFDKVTIQVDDQTGIVNEVAGFCERGNTASINMCSKRLIDYGIVDYPDGKGGFNQLRKFALTRDERRKSRSK
jgi:RimJ/RimL family protein N-acetyltransferase